MDENTRKALVTAIGDVTKTVCGTLLGGAIVFFVTNIYLQHRLDPVRNIDLQPANVYLPNNDAGETDRKLCKVDKRQIANVLSALSAMGINNESFNVPSAGAKQNMDQVQLYEYLQALTSLKNDYIVEAEIPASVKKVVLSGGQPLVSCDKDVLYPTPTIAYEWLALMGESSSYFIDRECTLHVKLPDGNSFSFLAREANSPPGQQFIFVNGPTMLKYEPSKLELNAEQHGLMTGMIRQFGRTIEKTDQSGERDRAQGVQLTIECPVIMHGRKVTLKSNSLEPLHITRQVEGSSQFAPLLLK